MIVQKLYEDNLRYCFRIVIGVRYLEMTNICADMIRKITIQYWSLNELYNSK